MKERGILFSAPMVRALLAGTKTQTRRIVKPHRNDDSFVLEDHGNGWWPYRSEDGESSVMSDGCEYPFNCPYGVPGDRLYVREAWRVAECYNDKSGAELDGILSARNVQYEAVVPWLGVVAGRYRHARFMPRWASRITLEITDVRVEPLQEISQADAIAEGAPPSHPSIDVISREYGYEDFSRSWYAQLWEQINGPGSWLDNPWVWVVCFRRIP